MSIAYQCETIFWNQTLPNNTFIHTVGEPMSAFSGVFIAALSVAWNGGLTQPRTRISLARASLFFCGVGTVAFHWISEQSATENHINRNSIDGVTMAFFTVNVLSLHVDHWIKKTNMLMAVGSILYILFWIFTNDSDTFVFLSNRMMDQNGSSLFSMCVQYPTFVLPYLYILGRILWKCKCATFREHIFMWIALLVAGASWVLYEFACSHALWLCFTHAMWHIGISYVSMYLIAIGAKDTYKLTQIPESSFWPQFYETQTMQPTDDGYAHAHFALRIPITKIHPKK